MVPEGGDIPVDKTYVAIESFIGFLIRGNKKVGREVHIAFLA